MTKSLRLIQHAIEEAWRDQVMGDKGPLQPDKKTDSMRALATLKVALPDILHFVWVGDLLTLDFEYINIWQQVNTDKRFIFWYDSHCSLCHRFHKLLAQHAKKSAPNYWQQWLIELQNNAFHYIYPRLDRNVTYDMLAKQFLHLLNIEIKTDPQPKPIFSPESVESLDIHHLFSGRYAKFKKYYYYEIILRGNLAAASDIIRMLILYEYGGIYIDTDTLPAVSGCFPETCALLKKHGIDADEYAMAAMAEAFLQNVKKRQGDERNIDAYIDKVLGISSSVKITLSSSINKEAKKTSLESLPPLGKVLCYPNFIMQSAVAFLPGVYYSNVLGACPGSKTISILLRSINKRYSYLEKSDAIFTYADEDCAHHYLGRLLSYRHESIVMSGEVTLILTGPGLIVEVLLGLSYQLLKLNEDIPPSFISAFMHNNFHGIAFFEHTLHTPAGLVSTWMK